jgi:hypothetical protein
MALHISEVGAHSDSALRCAVLTLTIYDAARMPMIDDDDRLDEEKPRWEG